MLRSSRSRLRPRGRVVVAALVLASLTACSGSDGSSSSPSGPASSASSIPTQEPTPEPVQTVATIATVSGKFNGQLRSRLRDRVAATVDEWIDAAYADGPYPRVDFADAFGIFTSGAASRAEADRGLMSNADIGADVDEVVMTNRRLRIDVLAVQRKAIGVTVRVALGMRLTGARERRERVTGSLFMTYGKGGWHVFGYDMDRGEV
ncbi:hypothetical protein BH11ACT8_BH11ACT8_21860 [soil metagenome]